MELAVKSFYCAQIFLHARFILKAIKENKKEKGSLSYNACSPDSSVLILITSLIS